MKPLKSITVVNFILKMTSDRCIYTPKYKYGDNQQADSLVVQNIIQFFLLTVQMYVFRTRWEPTTFKFNILTRELLILININIYLHRYNQRNLTSGCREPLFRRPIPSDIPWKTRVHSHTQEHVHAHIHTIQLQAT